MPAPDEGGMPDCRSSSDIERLYPGIALRLARGELLNGEMLKINAECHRIAGAARGGSFNRLQYFHFRFPEQAAMMSAFLLRERLHRVVPGSTRAATPEEVEAEWARRAAERRTILAWARTAGVLMAIVQAYRFERHRGSYSFAAQEAAAGIVAETDPAVGDPLGWACVCIEWAEREHRSWFWRCTRDHHFL